MSTSLILFQHIIMSYPTKMLIKANSKLDFQIGEIGVRQQDTLTIRITKGQWAHSAYAGLRNEVLHMYLRGLYSDIYFLFSSLDY